jgi:hypothetical protein
MSRIVSILCVFFFAQTHAQEKINQDNFSSPISRTIFKISPQHFVDNTLKIGIERFNKAHSKSLEFSMGVRADNKSVYATEGFIGLAGEFQYRLYVNPLRELTSQKNKKYSQGIYLAGFIQGASYSSDRVYQPDQFTRVIYSEHTGNWAGGFTIGWQRVFWNSLFLDIYCGGGMQWSDVIHMGSVPRYAYYDDSSEVLSPGYQGIIPKLGVKLGLGL